MEQETNMTTTPAETPATPATPTPAPAPKKKPVKEKKSRTIEELEDVAPNRMTDAERIAYIKALRGAVNLYKNKYTEMRANSESAFKLSRRNEAIAKHLLNAQAADFNQIQTSLEQTMTSIMMLAKIRSAESEELTNGN